MDIESDYLLTGGQSVTVCWHISVAVCGKLALLPRVVLVV